MDATIWQNGSPKEMKGYVNAFYSGVVHRAKIWHTVFILIEARRASTGISPSETLLISEKKIVIETPLTSYILQVFIGLVCDLLKQVCTKCKSVSMILSRVHNC